MTKFFAALLLFPLLASGADASRVMEVLGDNRLRISAPTGTNYAEGDFLCVARDSRNIACGIVDSAASTGVSLVLDFVNEAPQTGDLVLRPSTGKPRSDTPLVESDSVMIYPFSRPKNWFRAALLHDRFHFLTSYSYERAINNRVSWGGKFDWYDSFNVDTTLDGYGALLTRTFFTQPSFSGIALQLGAGAYFFTARQGASEYKGASFIGEISIGWRWQLRSWMGIGFQAGVRWLTTPQFDGYTLSGFKQLRAAVGADLSLRL